MSSNDQIDNNNAQSEDGTNRGRHLTNMQLSQQVNQLSNIVAKVQNDQQAFQQQLLAQIGLVKTSMQLFLLEYKQCSRTITLQLNQVQDQMVHLWFKV